MIHIEVRKKIVAARKKGIPVCEICKVNDVSKSAVYKFFNQEKDTGTVAPRTSECGRKPILDEADLQAIDQLIKGQGDITLQEIKETRNLHVSISTISWTVRNKLGYRYKKRRCMPESETART